MSEITALALPPKRTSADLVEYYVARSQRVNRAALAEYVKTCFPSDLQQLDQISYLKLVDLIFLELTPRFDLERNLLADRMMDGQLSRQIRENPLKMDYKLYFDFYWALAGMVHIGFSVLHRASVYDELNAAAQDVGQNMGMKPAHNSFLFQEVGFVCNPRGDILMPAYSAPNALVWSGVWFTLDISKYRLEDRSLKGVHA